MVTAVMICSTVSLANAESSPAFDGWEIAGEKADRHVKEGKSSLQYEKLMDSFEDTETGELVYPEYYGGSYINDDGDAVVCVVAENVKEKERALKSIKSTTDTSDIKVKNVEYSYKELEILLWLLL